MFFNKLREENKEYLKDRIGFFAEIYTKDVIKGLKVTYKTLEELIAEYKHTKWENLTPFEANILIDRFNLASLMGNLALYKGSKITFADCHYVGDTLIKVKERQEERTVLDKEIKKSFSEKCLPPIVADINGNTMKFSDFKAIEKIKSILKNQKSTVKAISLIKEVLKDVE